MVLARSIHDTHPATSDLVDYFIIFDACAGSRDFGRISRVDLQSRSEQTRWAKSAGRFQIQSRATRVANFRGNGAHFIKPFVVPASAQIPNEAGVAHR